MTPTPQIPIRSEIPEADTWDLTHIFKTEEEYRKSFSDLKNCYANITEFKGHLGDSTETLLRCLEFEKRLEEISERLAHYSSLKNSEDSSNNENLSRHAELTNLLTKVHEAASYINPEIQAIPEDKFERFLEDPVLTSWKLSMRKLRRYKPHTLSEPEERLLTLGAPVIRGHSETFSQLTNVDMKFGALINEDGQEVALSQSAYLSFLHKKDRDLRRKAFHQFYQEFDDHKYSLASALASSVRADVFSGKIRNYPSAREASLFGDNIPVAVYYKSDVFSDVFTLDHEAGHSMHTWFAQKHQLFQDYGYPIFLAEVASTFNEELLTHHLLKRAQEPQMRAYLIDRQIEDIRQVLFRQTMFAEFEKQVHEIEENGGPLTLDVL